MTSTLVTALLFIGAFGCLGLSVLCPLLAMPGYYVRRLLRKQASSDGESSTSPARLEIVIPAFNEADCIGDTLKSIERSIQYLRARPLEHPVPDVLIRVAADGCTDQTAQVARQFPGVSVTESTVNHSKWITVKKLLSESAADWILLVDSGTIWPETLLSNIVESIGRDKNIIAAAPAYLPLKAGWLNQSIWSLEKTLKTMETICGGPVSLHGATVAYKTSLLKKALVHLGDRPWLNDDVVIPLTLRALNPEGLILYPVGQVRDTGAGLDQPDFGRRRRMLQGNLQWVRFLLWDSFRRNPVAGIVAGRRLFRVLWAYWALCLAAAFVLAWHGPLWPGIIMLSALVLFSGSFRQFAAAAGVSLMTPLLVLRTGAPAGTWK